MRRALFSLPLRAVPGHGRAWTLRRAGPTRASGADRTPGSRECGARERRRGVRRSPQAASAPARVGARATRGHASRGRFVSPRRSATRGHRCRIWGGRPWRHRTLGWGAPRGGARGAKQRSHGSIERRYKGEPRGPRRQLASRRDRGQGPVGVGDPRWWGRRDHSRLRPTGGGSPSW